MTPNTARPRGLFHTLTTEQRAKALAYDGPEIHGGPTLAAIATRAMLECAESGNTCSSPCPWCLNEARIDLETESRGE